jgi:hypothetical protein
MEGPPNMGKPLAGLEGGDRVSTVELLMNPSRPNRDQRLRLELTPSRGKIHKESLGFWIIEPVILSVLSKIRFRVLKAYFLPVKSKIRFQVFTVLPLGLFWS